MIDVAVVGAGPVGLACAIEARQAGLTAAVLEKGALVNSLLGYPTNMEFFSTPDLLEIGDHPFATNRYKPLREEAIDYYRRVAGQEGLDVRLYTRVLTLKGTSGEFLLALRHEQTGDDDVLHARRVVVATGFFDVPNLLGVPGENLAKVSHYFKEPYPYTGQRVLIVGAKNSAAKAALSCYRNGAHVTMAVRGPEVSDRVKYWLRPDLLNRIDEGAIAAHFSTTVKRIEQTQVVLETSGREHTVPNDFVLAMTGYRPDYGMLETFGIGIDDDASMTPTYHPDTFQTTRAGVYIAGTVCGGLRTGRWFIENGRFHARAIMDHIAGRSS